MEIPNISKSLFLSENSLYRSLPVNRCVLCEIIEHKEISIANNFRSFVSFLFSLQVLIHLDSLELVEFLLFSLDLDKFSQSDFFLLSLQFLGLFLLFSLFADYPLKNTQSRFTGRVHLGLHPAFLETKFSLNE